jgi:hypothetical protein
MPTHNSITFALEGEVTLEDFSKGIKCFTDLVKTLTLDIAGKKQRLIG